MLDPYAFSTAVAITPAAAADWEAASESWYWLARTTIDLGGVADPAGLALAVAADRHYWLILDGTVVLRYRQCASADAMLFVQHWHRELAAVWRRGRHDLAVLVRSDPGRDKHHRALAPLLCLELRDAVGEVLAATGAEWQVARLDGWRRRRAKATTRIYETVDLVPSAEAWAGSLPWPERWLPAQVSEKPLPPLRCWTRRPARVDRHAVAGLAAGGRIQLPGQVYDVDCSVWGGTRPLDLVFDCESDRPVRVPVASTSLRCHRLLVDGVEVARRDDDPGPQQQGLPAVLAPLTVLDLAAGRHRLLFRYESLARGWHRLRLAIGHPLGQGRMRWRLQDRAIDPAPQACGIAEAIGAKALLDGEGVAWRDGAVHVAAGTGWRSAVLDIGRPINARLSLRCRSSGPGILHLAYGRWLHRGAVDCHRQRFDAVDVLRLPDGESRFEAIDVRHLRYLDLVVEGCTGGLVVDGWSFEEEVSLEGAGTAWRSDDAGLDAIVATSRRTAELCTDLLYMDNPDREQAQWIDNLTPITLAGYYWSGETTLAGKALLEVALHAAADGQVPGHAPGAWFPRLPLQCHMALYLQACVSHYFHSGDVALGRRLLDTIAAMLAHWRRHRDADGLLVDLHTVFVDWGSHAYSYGPIQAGGAPPATGALTTLNAYQVLSLQAASRCAAALGEEAMARDWAREAAIAATAMRRRLFDPERRCFRDGDASPAADRVSQTANALAVWAGVVDAATGADILRRLYADPPPAGVVPANAHFAYQTLSALFGVGLAEEACAWLRRGFGPMVASGSLWESWEPYASPCQGTGSAVAALLARHLAGLYPHEPGYAAIGFAPQAGLLGSLQARLHLPGGRVEVTWRRRPDGGLDAELGLPPAWRERPVHVAPGVECRVVYRSGPLRTR